MTKENSDSAKCTTCGGKKDENPYCSNSFHCNTSIGIEWEEKLDEFNIKYIGGVDMIAATHIEKLYNRCDALLRRLNEQEKLIVKLLCK